MSSSQLTLHLSDGTVSFKFTPEAAQELQQALNNLMSCLKIVANQTTTAVKAAPQKPIEYQYTGDVFLEIFCNPNIWPTPFAAKALVTVRDERIRITTEAMLTNLLEDVSQYLEQMN